MFSVLSVVGKAESGLYSLFIFSFISVKCLNCKGVSDTFDPYLDITLEIKVSSAVTVVVKSVSSDFIHSHTDQT